MPLANGRSFLAIPGPSMLPDAVLQAMHRPSPDIYKGPLIDMVAGILPDLSYVAQTQGHAAIYICNGHGVWEAALANTVAPGEKVLVPCIGAFALGWAETARKMGIEAELIQHDWGQAICPDRVRAALEADKAHKIKAVLAVHVDTSSSARSDMQALRAVLDDLGHPALLMADCIASMGCDRFEMDAWGVDIAMTGCQKGLMVPAGMAFLFVNDRAREQRARMTQVSGYWDWEPRINPELFYQHFCGTAPTHHLYGLRVALDMIRAEGIENVWARHAVLAQALRAAVTHWGQSGPFQTIVARPEWYSNAVTAVRLGKGNGDRLRAWCEAQAGVILGIGLGVQDDDDPQASGYFRFGHMGHVNAPMIMGVIGVVEAGLQALDIPHEPGGVMAASRLIAQSALTG